ncbi:hypothetical protein LJ656_13695 [Paraburkholderia sp. MMS20-SJTR3]|uniref:Uncharacterized protein n=1 Tax=Paraburkholderia sejongensis TaxID=2886946 RepID=A0ABS8JVB8_9BURK|nr:hypothetical protein [Paraburkholderia sp. MMS20-SJTR3]MCC8393643.1 hypothetical protein [Paraburkholderia sp. MMS20-SJTR3]
MLNAEPHTVTRDAAGQAVSLVFYPDTGCLRFADPHGVCHELRPPHSWLAITAASRGVRRGTQALADALNVLLHEFCIERPRWFNGPVRVSADVAPDALFRTAAVASAHERKRHASIAEPFTASESALPIAQ